MTKSILLALLILLPACDAATVAVDGASDDAGPTSDVVGAPTDAAFSPDVDSGPPIDGGSSASDAPILPDIDGGGSTMVDAGSVVTTDAPIIGADAWTGVCGDTFVDDPETCDPAFEGGSHISMSCPLTGAGACRWCAIGRLGTGCVYGDYASEPRTSGWTYACRDSANNDLSWVVWHTGAERDAVIAAYREIGATTNVAGWIGLSASSDGMTPRWADDGTTLTADSLLPFQNTRTAGRNCISLTVTPSEAYLRYESCTSTTIRGLCVTQPWGTVR